MYPGQLSRPPSARFSSSLVHVQEVRTTATAAAGHLAELGEVVLVAEGALPQARLVVADGLVVALPLGPPVSDARHHAGHQLPCRGAGGSHLLAQLVHR